MLQHFLLFLFLLSSRLFPAYGKIVHQSLETVFLNSYDAHINLIRQGVPSTIVAAYYDEALQKVTEPNCLRKDKTIHKKCIRSAFTDNKNKLTATPLSKLLKEDVKDNKQSPRSGLFPIYIMNRKKALPSPTPPAAEAVDVAYDATLSGLRKYAQDTSLPLPRSTFPADEDIVWDATQSEDCQGYSIVSPNVPAPAIWSYALGLALQLGFSSNTAQHDAGNPLLVMAAEKIFWHLRCQRKSGSLLRIPLSFTSELSKEANLILEENSSDRREKIQNSGLPVDNFVGITIAASVVFKDLIPKLGVFGAIGRPVVYFGGREASNVNTHVEDTGTKSGKQVNTEESQVEVRMEAIVDQLEERKMGDYQSQIHGNRYHDYCGSFVYIRRLVPVTDPMECCCPQSCEAKTSSILDVLTAEDCCAECNGVNCGGGGVGVGVGPHKIGADAQSIMI